MIGIHFYSKNRWIQIAIVCIFFYVGVCIGVFLIQDNLLFHPNPLKSDIQKAQEIIPSLQEVIYRTQDGRDLYGFFAHPKRQKKIVLFLHGNSYHLNSFLSRIQPFVRAGYGIMMAEYTGFGGISGKIRQSTLEQDALAAIHYLNQQGYQNKDIVIYGYSLGTYLAIHIAAEKGQDKPFNALILEAPFTSLVDAASDAVYHLLPVGLLMSDGYFSIDKIAKVKTRIFIAHGRLDKTVPYEQGVSIFNAAPNPKVFFSSDRADHRSLPEHGFFDSVLDWLSH